MIIQDIKKELLGRGIPLADIRIKYAAGVQPAVCIRTRGEQWTCVPSPKDDDRDEEFADFLIAERDKALKK